MARVAFVALLAFAASRSRYLYRDPSGCSRQSLRCTPRQSGGPTAGRSNEGAKRSPRKRKPQNFPRSHAARGNEKRHRRGSRRPGHPLILFVLRLRLSTGIAEQTPSASMAPSAMSSYQVGGPRAAVILAWWRTHRSVPGWPGISTAPSIKAMIPFCAPHLGQVRGNAS